MSQKGNFVVLLGLVLLAGCGPQRKNFFARTYHNTVSYFNGYYHANLNYQWGLKELEKGQTVPTDGFLSLMMLPPTNGSTSPRFDTAISKDDVVIFRHPNSKWVDNARFLTGRAQFYKANFPLAIQNFNYVLFAFPESNLIPEVTFWLARTYYVKGNAFRAQELLKSLPAEADIRPETRVSLAEMRVTLMIENAEHSNALAILEQNRTYVKGRKRKARWDFLIAQLYDHLGNLPKAFEHYAKAAKLNVATDLTFNAKLRMAGLYARGENVSAEKLAQVRQLLNKMLKEAKYVKFRDQVYYQLALLEEGAGNISAALALLQKSLNANTNNNRQRVLAYYRSGQIYFYTERDFFKAQAYYDSAAAKVSAEMPEQELIKQKAETLRHFVQHHKTLHVQDSLLTLSQLSPEAQAEAAAVYIDKEDELKRQAEAEQLRLQEEMRRQSQFVNQQTGPMQQGQGSSFYFTDQNQVARGKAEFERIWGNRANEDHWRRRNKMAVMAATQTDAAASAAPEGETREERIQRYLANVPNTPGARDTAQGKMQVAYFELGQIYIQKLEMPDTGIFYLQELVRLYPNIELALKAKYAIYTAYRSVPNIAQADAYKREILDRHPTSIYAKLINREAVPDENESARREFNENYTLLYGMHESGDCETVISYGQYVAERHAASPELAKVLFLRGSCFGMLNKRDSLKAIFQHIASAYPNSDVGPIAKRTLQLLENPGAEATVSQTAQENQAGASASDTTDPRVAGFELTQRPNDPIYVVVFVRQSKLRTNDLNLKISDFNRLNFGSDNLRTNIFAYRPDTSSFHMAYINAFADFAAANRYVKALAGHGPLAALLEDPAQDVLPITGPNFRVAFSQKRFTDYRLFLNRNRQAILGTAATNP